MRLSPCANTPTPPAHLFAAAAFLALVAGMVPAALQAADLESEYVIESRLLENELEIYLESRDSTNRAVRDVREIAAELDDVLAHPNSSVAQMRSVEATFATARQIAFLRLEETAVARERMYDRMERLEELARGLERLEPEPLADEATGPNGLWEFRLEGAGVYALVELAFETSGLDRSWTVLGNYRNSNGHRGTLRGLLRGDRLELEVMDSRRGKVANLDGTVEPSGRLQGIWTAVQTGLTPTGAKGGTWTAHRVSSESDVQLD